MNRKRLPLKQQRFVANYILLNGNGVKAVAAAGYNQGYNAACVTASRLLRKTKVEEQIEKHAAKAKLSADQVIEELSDVAKIDVPLEATQKLKALELLGKYHKLFTEKIETADTTPDTVESAQDSFARQYRRINGCSEAEALAAAEAAFAFARVDDRTADVPS